MLQTTSYSVSDFYKRPSKLFGLGCGQSLLHLLQAVLLPLLGRTAAVVEMDVVIVCIKPAAESSAASYAPNLGLDPKVTRLEPRFKSSWLEGFDALLFRRPTPSGHRERFFLGSCENLFALFVLTSWGSFRRATHEWLPVLLGRKEPRSESFGA